MTERPEIRILASTSTARIINREVSRRAFLSFTAAAGAAAVLAACTPAKTAGSIQATGGPLESKMSMYSWGDYDSPDVIEAFTKDLGPAITTDAFNSNEEMISKLVAAKGTSGYDIVVPTGPFIPQMVENGLLEKLNHDLLPNLKYMDPAFLAQAWDKENAYSICKAWGTTGFAYDTTVISRDLTTWQDFLDAAQNEASGKTSLLDDPAELTGLYFWANGIDWNTTDQADLDAAQDFLVNTLAKHISAFDSYPGGATIPNNAQTLVQVWNGDARIGMLNNAEPDRWAWRLGSPSTELWMDNWAIAAGAPHPEAAHAWINYTMTPETQLTQVDYIGYNTGAADIQQAAEDEGLELLDMVFFTPEQIETMHTGEVTEAQARVVEIWNATKAAAGA